MKKQIIQLSAFLFTSLLLCTPFSTAVAAEEENALNFSGSLVQATCKIYSNEDSVDLGKVLFTSSGLLNEQTNGVVTDSEKETIFNFTCPVGLAVLVKLSGSGTYPDQDNIGIIPSSDGNTSGVGVAISLKQGETEYYLKYNNSLNIIDPSDNEAMISTDTFNVIFYSKYIHISGESITGGQFTAMAMMDLIYN